MVAPVIVTILAYLHVFAAMGWLGGAALFLSVIAPGLRKLSPGASIEFLAKVGPMATRFFIGSATGTIVFGLALYFVLTFPPGSGIFLGILFGLAAYVDALVVAVPGFRKADHLAQDMMKNAQGGSPPPAFQKAIRRGGLGVASTVVLLVIALLFMVAAGFPF
jgi:hypothetical protein